MTLDAQITDLEQRRAELLGQLASVGQMRPGSLTLRSDAVVQQVVIARSPATPDTGRSCR